MTYETKIRLALADDHTVFRDGLLSILESDKRIEVVSAAADGEKLVKDVQVYKPDVVMTDIRMPVMDGIEATRIISRELPGTCVIALSMFNEESMIVEMLEAGASGYILKDADKNEIIEAIQNVYKGGTYYCRNTARSLAHLVMHCQYNPYKLKGGIPYFSPKELEIVKCLCKEMNSHEIAEEMNISKRTIDGLRLRLQEKMQVKTTVGIVLYAVKRGIYRF